jgi:hypothetical protein
VETSVGTVCEVLELGMCWRWASNGVWALLELRAGVESGGLSIGLRWGSIWRRASCGCGACFGCVVGIGV